MSAEIQAITMPKWGLAMDEGTVAAWHVAPGGEINAGADLVDIETSKITNVLESPSAGLLRRCTVEAGETVPIGALLGVVAAPEVAEAEIDAFVEGFDRDFATRARETAEEPPAVQTVEVEGLPLAYLAMGEAEGPPIVLIHGFGGDLNNWLFNLPALAENRRVYALDLPGHGHSGKDLGAMTGRVGLEGLARTVFDFASAVAETSGGGGLHLVGHSLGGAVALQMALTRPVSVASLTMIAPAGFGPEINADYIEGFIAADRRREMKRLLQQLFADPALVNRDMVEDLLVYKRLDGVPEALRLMADGVFPGGRQGRVLSPGLSELTLPVQVLWGTEDRILPASQAADLPASVQVHLLPDRGHMVHMEAAAEVNRLIQEIAG